MIKEEVRILIIDKVLHNFSIYIILRGIKGMEHLGLVKGDVEDVIIHLKRIRLLDEIRYVVLYDGRILEVKDGNLISSQVSGEELKFIINLTSIYGEIIKVIEQELKTLIHSNM